MARSEAAPSPEATAAGEDASSPYGTPVGEGVQRAPRFALQIEPFAALAAVLWASSYPATQVALRSMSPFAVAFWRTATGMVFLAIISFAGTDKPIELGHLRLAHWWRLAALGVLSTSGFVALLNFAILKAGPVMASFIVSTYPALTLLLAPLVVGEHPAFRKTAGAIVSVAGAFLLLGVSQTLGDRAATSALIGGGLALGASFCFGFYVLLTRRWTHAFHLDARTIAFFSPVFSTPLLLLLVLVASPGGFGSWRPDSAAAVLWLAIFCTGVAYLALNHSLRRQQASSSSLALLLVPVVASLLSYVALGAQMQPIQWVGALISLGGMFAAMV